MNGPILGIIKNLQEAFGELKEHRDNTDSPVFVVGGFGRTDDKPLPTKSTSCQVNASASPGILGPTHRGNTIKSYHYDMSRGQYLTLSLHQRQG